MNLEAGTPVDPCWNALNNGLISEQEEKKARACQKWREIFAQGCGGDDGDVRGLRASGHGSGGDRDRRKKGSGACTQMRGTWTGCGCAQGGGVVAAKPLGQHLGGSLCY
eukprot:CAMPEP_0194670004 /NCGR_PEP_ID=MMETSP0295-20121207/4932_1 /TAXON_ID=39354 /ORGANISM="Heterosigma akashiwo, Strain CCMP2393" /LENGTH=108 /DNA_ID=CAMNT_0039553121 /DNA_START=687 /DNA_END=1013 /DNA_ORIENTATION=+